MENIFGVTFSHHWGDPIENTLGRLNSIPGNFLLGTPESSLMSPKKKVSDELKEKLEQAPGVMEYVEKIEVAGPGFINFYLKPEVFLANVGEIVEAGEKYGRSEMLSGKKAIIEYTDPNPFKEFHIGHLMANTIGESISRLIEWSGAETKRACYQGDAGMHVAKTLWGIKNSGNSQSETVGDLGQAYALGARAYEDDENAKKEIQEINKKIYDKSDEEINTIYETGRKISLDYFETIYKKLGTKFDYYFFESETGVVGKKLVLERLGEGIFEKGTGGAIIFPGERYGLHTRVFINSEDLPTYEAKELGLAPVKYEKYPYDLSVVITGNEVNDYFKVVHAALEQIFPDLAKKTFHRSHGMLRLPTGKMSSRTGDVITAESLIAQVEGMVQEKIAEREFSEEEKKEIAEKVAIGAIKFSILRQATGKDIIFDFEKSLSFEGDSGPYLQYTITRAKSVLHKAAEQGVAPSAENAVFEGSALEKLLFERFPEVLEKSALEYEPHYLVTYLLELAAAFNSYYGNSQIIGVTESPYRLLLTQATAQVLENGLTVLGMPVLERM